MSKEEKQFWEWFSIHNTELCDTKKENSEELLNELLEVLNLYCKELSFEIGEQKNDKMELIITANGNKDYFNKVKKLVKSAPKYNKWVITAFKPPMARSFSLTSDGIEMNTNKIYFDPLKNKSSPKELGLMVYIEGYDKNNKNSYMKALSNVLQTIVGEKSFANDINYIEIKKLIIGYEKYISIKELPEYIKWNKFKKFKLLRRIILFFGNRGG